MNPPGHAGPPGDLIGEYLAQLRAALPVPRRKAELILAEAEDHLRETVSAGMAAGMTEPEAQQAAISSFGAVRAVVRAHQARYRRIGAIFGDLVLAAWKLASLVVLAIGVGGLALMAVIQLTSPLNVRVPGGTINAINEDPRWILFGVVSVLGVVLLTGYWLARRVQRRHAPEREMLARFFPAVAVSFFSAIGLVVLGFTWDGTLFSGAIFFAVAFLALAVGYSARMVQALLRRG